MTPDEKISLFDQLLDSMWETQSFQEALENDPLLLAAGQRRDALLDAATENATRDQREDLREAITFENNQFLTFGALYGFQLASAILEISSRPSDLTNYILYLYKKNAPGMLGGSDNE